MAPLPGDFACFHEDNTAGVLIAAGEWLNGDGTRASYFQHAGIYIGMGDRANPLGYIMAAQPGGARVSPLRPSQADDSVNPGVLWSTGRIALDDAQRSLIVANALKCEGVPYSAADYFALAAHRLHVPVPWLRGYIADSGHMICSQLVDWCYMKAGVHLFSDGRWTGYVTPANLADLIMPAAHA